MQFSVPVNKALVHRKIQRREVFFPHICGRSTTKDKQCKKARSKYTFNILDIVDSVKVVLGIGNSALGIYCLMVRKVLHAQTPNVQLPMINCQGNIN